MPTSTRDAEARVDEAEMAFWGTCCSCLDTTIDGVQTPSTTKGNF